MIDNTQLAALVASRLCHDMVEPMNAMLMGLDSIKASDGKADPDAISLIEQGVHKSWAKLEFFRFAIAGALTDGDSFLEEGRDVANKLYGEFKADLVWSAPSVAMPRRAVRVIVNLLFIANQCLPRGGAVEVTAEPEGEGGAVHIVASGARAMIKPDTQKVLEGNMTAADVSYQNALPYLARLYADAAGMTVSVNVAPERIELIARAASFRV